MHAFPDASPPALRSLAAFAAALRPEDLPPPIRATLRSCLVDALWGALHVHHDRRALAALAAMPATPSGRAHVLTTGQRGHAGDVAFVGALAAAATDRSDTHLPTATHPGIIVVPAVLAALEDHGGSGLDLERGVAVGYEIMGRIARAVTTPGFAAIFRPTAVAAPVAAAMAVASALRLGESAILVAGSLAAQTAIGFNEWARAGTGEHVFHAGIAARNAIQCAYLAAEGFEAAPTALDGVSGLLAGFGARERAGELTRGLGTDFELAHIAFKPAPACFFAQTPIQVAAGLAAEVDPAAVETIEIRVTATAAAYPGCAAATGIDSMQAAVMSIPFAVAATLRAGGLDVDAWTGKFDDPAIAGLAARCRVVADAALTAAYPGRSGCIVTVGLSGGVRRERRHDDFVSMDAAAVEARFRGDGDRLLAPGAVDAALAAIAGLESLADAGQIAAGLAGTSPATASSRRFGS